MPACARKEIVRQGESGIYHCWAACRVRLGFFAAASEITAKGPRILNLKRSNASLKSPQIS